MANYTNDLPGLIPEKNRENRLRKTAHTLFTREDMATKSRFCPALRRSRPGSTIRTVHFI